MVFLKWLKSSELRKRVISQIAYGRVSCLAAGSYFGHISLHLLTLLTCGRASGVSMDTSVSQGRESQKMLPIPLRIPGKRLALDCATAKPARYNLPLGVGLKIT